MELAVIRGAGNAAAAAAPAAAGRPSNAPPGPPGPPAAATHVHTHVHTHVEQQNPPASPANSASPAQQLDDGYGSSNSSPHSSGVLSTACGLARHKGAGTPLHKPALSAVVNIRENLAASMGRHPSPGHSSGFSSGFSPGPSPSPTAKKDVQVEVADKGYKSYVVPSPSPDELTGSEDSADSAAEDDGILDTVAATTPTTDAAGGNGAGDAGGRGGASGGPGGGGGGAGIAVKKKRRRHKKARKEVVVVQGPAVDPERETWGRNADFLLSIIGFAVDLANVWRFPYLCYRNGGGAFLVPYTLMLIFGAVPLFYMELILGQYNRQGPISVWRICPLFKGVGFCAVMVAFYVSFYYNVIIGWALYFMAATAAAELPWLHCNNTWNTEWCWESPSAAIASNLTNLTNLTASKLHHSPAAEYFHRGVLEMQWSEGLHDVGAPKWQLVVCLGLVYCMLYLSLFKGVKSSGLVVWVTATMPYVVLTILLIRGLMLPGALTGIAYYLQPELARLQDTQVWVDAAVQIFYSVGAGFGVHLSYASYNHFDNNCFNDCLITTAVNCFTSFFSGFVIFTYLGFMSHKQGIHISNVATEGPGLVFQVYPEAVATLPGSHFWSLLFFFMLIMLGLDSAMGGMECVITGLMDEFHDFFHGRRYAREIFTLCAICVSFCVALVNVTPGGIYMFHLFDTYSAGISLLCSALFEAIAVSWFYGLERFSQDVNAMLGFKPGLYWRICWKFISPLFLIGVVMFGLLYHQPLQYNEYHYPAWAEVVGWGLALSSIIMIPLVAIIQLCKTPGTLKERFAINISPVEEHDHIRRTKEVKRFRWRHWRYI